MRKVMIYFCYTIMVSLFLTMLSCDNQSVPTVDDFDNQVPENVHLSGYSSSTITVAWDSIADAASYTVELLDSVESDLPLDTYTTVSGDFYKFDNLRDTLDYYVRVRANFNTIENPVKGDWVYIKDGKKPARLIPLYGVVDEDFKLPWIYPDFPEGFEEHDGKRKGSYTASGPTGRQSDVFPSGEWQMYRSYTTNSGKALVHKVGKYAAMLSPHKEAFVAMDFDLKKGASKLSFVCGSATSTNKNDVNNMPITLSVYYSIDGGESWNKIDDILIEDVETQYTPEYDDLDIKDPVRFKFQKDAGVARPIIDEVRVYYTD